MGELRLYAIGVDEVRDVFGAPPELAAEFRRVVAEQFPPVTTPKAPGMLGKLGPLFRRPPGAVLVRPDGHILAMAADDGESERRLMYEIMKESLSPALAAAPAAE